MTNPPPRTRITAAAAAAIGLGMAAFADAAGADGADDAEADRSRVEFAARLDAALAPLQRAFIDEGVCRSNTAMVVLDGETVYHRAVQSGDIADRDIGDDTLFPIWSMTKPVTSVAAMILHERGAFGLDDAVSDAVPALSGLRVSRPAGGTSPLERPVTYRDLLRHTSGVYGYDGSFHEEGTWKEIIQLDDLDQVVELLATQPLQHQPGERYTYGMSTAVLGKAIENLTELPLEEFLEREIFRPLGMRSTRFGMSPADRARFQPLTVREGTSLRAGTPEEDELPYAPGSPLQLGGEGLVSTIGDYAKFCQMLVDRGRAPDGRQLIKAETLALMLEDQLGGIPGYTEEDDGYRMGLGFYVLERAPADETAPPARVFGWGGYHTTHFWVDPANRMFAVFMTRLYPYDGSTLERFRSEVYRALQTR